MSIATELDRLIAAKAAIRASIEAKGVTVPAIDTLDDYAAHVVSIAGAFVPSAFTVGEWTAAATATAGEISFNLSTLPSNGGTAITSLEYRVGTGSAIAFTGTGTGVRVVTAGLTAGVPVDLQVRASNVLGAGAWSDIKNRTPFVAAATAPAAFTVGQWTSTAGNTEIVVNIAALPSDGGSAITALQYTLNGSTWTSFAGTGTGSRTITGLTNSTAYPVQIRAVNAIGNGTASDTKSTTPTAATAAATWESYLTDGENAVHSPAAPAGLVSGDTQILVIFGVQESDTYTAPAGWTLQNSTHSNFGGNAGLDVYTAAGSTAQGTWTFASATVMSIHRVSGAVGVRGIAAYTQLTHPTGEEVSDMGSPSVTATEGDAVLSFYYGPQSTSAAGTQQAGYTRATSRTSPNSQSEIYQSDVAAGATGIIVHGYAHDYQARVATTIVLAGS